jgi:hypothetical protein
MFRRIALFIASAALLLVAIYFSALSARGNPWEKDREKRLRNFCIAIVAGASAYAVFRWAGTIDDH